MDRGRRDKKTRRALIGLLRVVEGWARVVLGRDEACVWRAVRAPESRAAAWLGFARCCWGVAGRLLARIVESPGLPRRVQVRLVEEPRGGFKAVPQDVMEEFTKAVGLGTVEMGGYYVDGREPVIFVAYGKYVVGGKLRKYTPGWLQRTLWAVGHHHPNLFGRAV